RPRSTGGRCRLLNASAAPGPKTNGRARVTGRVKPPRLPPQAGRSGVATAAGCHRTFAPDPRKPVAAMGTVAVGTSAPVRRPQESDRRAAVALLCPLAD